MKRLSRVVPRLMVTLVLIVAAATSSFAVTTEEAWTRGQLAFGEQDYRLALSWFEQARDAGQNGPAVHYNIGVCHYRLQQYGRAADSFALLDERWPKMRSLAQYNLGLVALKQSRRNAAADHFDASYRLSEEEPKLRAMSSTMLRRLLHEPVAAESWLRTVSMRGGYDDNVSLQDKTGLAPELSAESPLVELFATIQGPYARQGGFRLDGAFLLLHYPDADEFSQIAGQFGGLYDWRADDWGLQLAAHGSTTRLGGKAYDHSGRVSAKISRRLTPGSSLEARLRLDAITAGDSMFDGTDGSRQRLELRYRWHFNDRSFSLSLGGETNDRDNPAVAPERVKLASAYRYRPETGWGFRIGGEIRASEYKDGALVRDEDLAQLDFALTRDFASGWQVVAQYSLAENDSSDSSFSYTRQQLSLGAFRFF